MKDRLTDERMEYEDIIEKLEAELAECREQSKFDRARRQNPKGA